MLTQGKTERHSTDNSDTATIYVYVNNGMEKSVRYSASDTRKLD